MPVIQSLLSVAVGTVAGLAISKAAQNKIKKKIEKKPPVSAKKTGKLEGW